MSDKKRMMNIHKAARSALPETWDKNGGVIAWHPGAAKWFTEDARGVIPADQIRAQ